MLLRLLAVAFNRIPSWWQQRILDRAHARFLVGVVGIGLGPDGRLLLARHRFGQPEWRLLGGFMSRDETPREALAREIREETGLLVEVGPLLEANAARRWQRIELAYAFRVGGGSARLTDEVKELGTFAADDLPAIRADQRELIQRHAATALAWAREPRS